MAKKRKQQQQQQQPLWHITAVADLPSILRDGLRGGTTPRGRGETLAVPSIFALTHSITHLLDSVAINQIWPFQDIAEFAVVEIAPAGITGPVLPDNVAELVAPWHRIIQQDVIPPEHLTHHSTRRLDFPGVRLQEMLSRLLKRRLTAEEWELALKWWHPDVQQMQANYESKLKKRAKS